jgi:hypothetical protein
MVFPYDAEHAMMAGKICIMDDVTGTDDVILAGSFPEALCPIQSR